MDSTAQATGQDQKNLQGFVHSIVRMYSSKDSEDEVCELNQELQDFFGEKHAPVVCKNSDDSISGTFESARSSASTMLNKKRSLQSGGQSTSGTTGFPLEVPAGGDDTEDGAILSHVDEHGKANMVDTADKFDTVRIAYASGTVILGEQAFKQVKGNTIAKGDVLTVAKIAGINSAKQTAFLIPLCHTLDLRKVDVNFELDEELHAIHIKSMAKTVGATGVEVEAIMATTIAALTIYDMCKAVSKGITLQNIGLDYKSGGKSGVYSRSSSES